jgi:hypothetical protein
MNTDGLGSKCKLIYLGIPKTQNRLSLSDFKLLSFRCEGIFTSQYARSLHPVTIPYILDNPKYRGQIEYFFRWQDEQAQVLNDGEHAAIIG